MALATTTPRSRYEYSSLNLVALKRVTRRECEEHLLGVRVLYSSLGRLLMRCIKKIFLQRAAIYEKRFKRRARNQHLKLYLTSDGQDSRKTHQFEV